MRFLLDTCVISELVARQPDPGLVQWIDSTAEEKMYLSVITIGEIKKGIERLPDPRRKSELVEWLEGDLLIRFENKILSIDTDVMLVWGGLGANLERRGRKMPAIDSLIAAIAMHGKLDLVTRNEADFIHAGITVINPWKQ
ncbi:MAG: type II toxin-antitoxin system VapC family toxin [Anaerolineae bacterium]|jgi:tRNA(fMet)-specific endonuclease VapC